MLRNDSETRNGTQAPFLRGTSDPHQVTLRMLTGKTRTAAADHESEACRLRQKT